MPDCVLTVAKNPNMKLKSYTVSYKTDLKN